jgi:hypothetical protein
VAATSQELSRRVEALEVREAITALKARYWRAVDLGDAETVAACLAPDAIIDFDGLPRFETAAPFVETVRAAAAQGGTFHMHHGRNPEINLHGADSATGVWDIFYLGVLPGPRMIIQMAGAYSDRYRREAGHWLIAETSMRQTSMLIQTVGDDGVPRIHTLPGGSALDFTPSETR